MTLAAVFASRSDPKRADIEQPSAVTTDVRRAALPAVYEALAEHLGELLVLIDYDGTQVASLGPSPGLLGRSRGELEGEHIAERVHPDDLTRVLELLERGRHTPGLTEQIEVRARHRDGSWRRLSVTAHNRIEDDRLRGGVVRVRELPDEHGAHYGEADVAAVERSRFEGLAETLPIGVLSADAHGFVVFANHAAEALMGCDFRSMRGDRWLGCIHDLDRAHVADQVARLGTTRAQVDLTFRTGARGEERWVHLVVVPLVEGRAYVGWVATLDDVTEHLATQRELAYRATRDALTGLPNRWLLVDRLQQSLARVDHGRGGVAVVFVDLDRFKRYNDAHGHAGGDAVLKDVAARLRRALRPTDTAARLGGDEFVVLAEVDDWHEAADLAERVATTLHYELTYREHTLSVSASVGVSFSSDANVTPQLLLDDADACMYASRHDRSG